MEQEAASRAGQTTAVTGALIAGGRSARMGGREKALIMLAGKPMLAHVITRLAPQVGRLVLNVNGDPARFAEFRLPIVTDVVEGHAGPLAGLHAALAWAHAETPDARYVATAPIDTPFLPEDMVARLMAALREENARAAIAASGGRQHPTAGLWDVALAGEAADALQQGVRAMHRFAEMQGAATAELPLIRAGDVAIDPLFNVNTPADLEQAGELLAVLTG